MNSEIKVLTNKNSCRDSLLNVIKTALLRETPTANIYFQNWCAEDDYLNILRMLPGHSLFMPINHPEATVDGRATRFLYDLSYKNLNALDSERKSYWSAWLSKEFMSEFTETVFETLGITKVSTVLVPIFYTDFPGYTILPHLDASYKLATCQLYFPLDDKISDAGTEFYKGGPETGFELVSKNGFLPRAGYAFKRTNTSWHGVPPIGNLPYPRRSLAFTWYVPGYEYSSDTTYLPPEERPL